MAPGSDWWIPTAAGGSGVAWQTHAMKVGKPASQARLVLRFLGNDNSTNPAKLDADC